MDKNPENLVFRDRISFDNFDKIKPNRRRRSPVIIDLSISVDNELTPLDLHTLIDAGMNVARLRGSYSSTEDKINLLTRLNKAVHKMCMKTGMNDYAVATCISLKTCVTRTGLILTDEPTVEIPLFSEVIITNDNSKFDQCSPNLIYINNPYMSIEITVGMEISIDQGEIMLHSIEILNEKNIKCMVSKGGLLASMSLVSVRGIKHTRPYLTKLDSSLIQFALEYQVDMIIIYYVRNPETLQKAKRFMDKIGKHLKKPQIYVGICTWLGLQSLEEILKYCDGIIFPREILPFELQESYRYRLPSIQKWVSAMCVKNGKPLILSGGILEETLKTGVQHNSELADISNALLDGVTGFALTKCVDIGNTIKAVRALNDVCCTVEPFIFSKLEFRNVIGMIKNPCNAAETAVMSAALAAWQTKAQLIVVPTVSGRTVTALLQLRPACVIMTISTNYRIIRRLALFRSVVPLLYKGNHKHWHTTVQSRITYALEYASRQSWVNYGDIYVTLEKIGDDSSFCEVVRINKVDIIRKALVECVDEYEDRELKHMASTTSIGIF